MKKISLLLVLVMAIFAMSGCAAIGGIFKAGMATASIGIVILVLVVIWIISMFRSK